MSRPALEAIATTLLALLAACRIDAAYDDTMYQCLDGKCPPGFTCWNDQCIKPTDLDARTPPDPPPDAAIGRPDAAPDAAPPPDPRVGNVLYFTFDGDLPQMSIVLDRSPSSLHAGRAGGNPTSGQYGSGYDLDDADDGSSQPDYLFVPDSPRLFLGNQLTIEAWIEIDENQNQAIFTDFLGSATPEVEYGLEVTASGGLAFYSNACASGTEVATTSTVAIPLATYTHVAVTWDGSDVRFYVGGALAETVPFAHVPCESPGPREWRIGRRVGGANALDGEIDELKVSDYAKSEAEIAMSASFDSLAAGSVCGDGQIEGSEQCDGVNACCIASGCAFLDDGATCPGGACQGGACENGSGRVNLGLVALYLFDEGRGATVVDQSGVAPGLDLTIADPGNVTWGEGTLTLDTSTLVGSTAPAGKIASLCQDSDELTVEAWVVPANTTQEGPARIVTMSANVGERNFTLGQQQDAFILRVRSTVSSGNGEPLVHTPAADVATALTHVVGTRDDAGERRLYVDGKLRGHGRAEGNFSSWDARWNLGLGNEFDAVFDRSWLGTYHLVAVYCRALSGLEVAQNFFAGPDPER